MTSAESRANGAAPEAEIVSPGLRIARFFSRPFNTTYVVLTLIFLFNTWPPGDRLRVLVLATVLDLGLVQGIKQISWAPRPGREGRPHWGKGSRSGFPSGHTVPAFLLAFLVAHQHPHLTVFWFASAVAIAWSRVRVGAHYTYQVLLSAAIGYALGAIICGSILPN